MGALLILGILIVALANPLGGLAASVVGFVYARHAGWVIVSQVGTFGFC